MLRQMPNNIALSITCPSSHPLLRRLIWFVVKYVLSRDVVDQNGRNAMMLLEDVHDHSGCNTMILGLSEDGHDQQNIMFKTKVVQLQLFCQWMFTTKVFALQYSYRGKNIRTKTQLIIY